MSLKNIMLKRSAGKDMSVISTGDELDIYSNAVQAYDNIPVGTYKVEFAPGRGFYLKVCSPPIVAEKIYSCHQEKADKICTRFAQSTRNLGVILSGEKGLGKSITAKLICMNMLNDGIPVIIISEYIAGIADFMQRIKQRICVLFDEYDKVFDGSCSLDNDPNVEMLSLFDGIDIGNKLFVITCNSIYSLNEYLINRPGRFHFHINFNYPTDEEIREYMLEKVLPEYHDQIEEVITFSHRVNLNYDCLRAIATELNAGETFKSAIADLNILNIETVQYDMTITLTNGQVFSNIRADINLTNSNECYIGFYNGEVQFIPSDIEYNETSKLYTLDPNKVSLTYYNNGNQPNPRIKTIIFEKHNTSLHYASTRPAIRTIQ